MTAFVVAMDDEAAAVAKVFKNLSEETAFGRRVVKGVFGGEPVAMVVCGVGKSNAAAGAQLALGRYGADRLVNVGVAGGLKSEMRPGETYTSARAVQYDFDLSKINGTARGVLNECDTPYLPLVPVPGFPVETIATGDAFTDDDSDIPFLTNDLGAGLRDMEAGAVAHVAFHAGVPVSVLKTVTDVHGSTTSMTSQYKENLHNGLAALSIAVSRLMSCVPGISTMSSNCCSPPSPENS